MKTKFTLSFRFVDDDLNDRLVSLVKKAGVRHQISPDGAIRYSYDDEDRVENELIRSIRDHVFSSWQIVACPPAWIDRYMQYMTQHKILFFEECADGERWFLIPAKHRPHLWKLKDIEKKTERHAFTLR